MSSDPTAPRRPWMPFYVGDWLTSPDVQSMTHEERGVYLHLIFVSWNSIDGGLPVDDKRLSSIVGGDGAWRRCKEVVRPKFFERDGKLYHRKVRELIAEAKTRSDSAKSAASKRWS